MNQEANKAGDMDFKGFILWIAAAIVNDVNSILSTSLLLCNLVYIGYQVYTHHRRHKKEFDDDQEGNQDNDNKE